MQCKISETVLSVICSFSLCAGLAHAQQRSQSQIAGYATASRSYAMAVGVGLNPSSLAFGAELVGSTHSLPATLTNGGSATLSITSIGVSGYGYSQTNTCGSSLGAGKSCTITVTFRALNKGTFNGTLSVSDNNSTSPQQASLSGSGVYKKNLTPVTSPEVRSTLAGRLTAATSLPKGPAPVGTLVMDLVDDARDDPYLSDGSKRELLVKLWYPASLSQNCKPAEYTSAKVWDYLSRLTQLPLPAVITNSCMDAALADGQHPVVVFTHGYTGTFTDYTFLFEDLASRGYVIASVDHTYEATAVEFPDGRLAKSLLGSHLDDSWRTDDGTLSRALSARLDDLTFVMNELEILNGSGGSPFSGKLDLTQVALAGHSLGGLTTWLGIQRESRFKAAVLLDPYLADIGSDPTETPVLLMTMGREKPSQDDCNLWSDLQGPRFWINLRGAEHVTPSDAVWLAKGAIQTGAMGPEKTIDALRRYIAAFLDTNLRGQPADVLLEGLSPAFPEVVVTTQDQPLCRQP
jgi:pimeloyl-ACP methyl ester carboxylesterase